MQFKKQNLSILLAVLLVISFIPVLAVTTIPAQPTNLFASLGLSGTSINLSWTEGSNGGTALIGHYIYRNITNTVFGNFPLLTTHEKSYWKFDGNGTGTNNQTDYGTLGNKLNMTGKYNNDTGVVATAWKYANVATHFTAQHPSNYAMERTDTFSICFAMNRPNTVANEFIIGKNAAGALEAKGVTIWTDGVSLNYDFVNTAGGVNQLRVRDGSNLLNNGVWHFVCMTYNGLSNTNSIKVYYDGVNKTSQLTSISNTLTASIATTNNFAIAAETDNSQPYIGKIDEVRFYDNVLTLAQVQALAAYTLPSVSQPYNDAGLVSGQSYQYKVSSVNSVGESIQSSSVSTIAAAAAPSSITGTNAVIAPITYQRTDPSSTSTLVNVTRPNTYSMTCNLSYEFANINKTYDHIANNSSPQSGYVQTTFTFTNGSKDLVTFLCRDKITGTSAKYELTQTNNNIPLVQQVQNFRAGVYGTQGYVGTLDLVTLIVLIIAMVGLNRVNETVGAIFMVFIIGALAYFQIVSWPVILTASVALVLMITVISTRKLAYS